MPQFATTRHCNIYFPRAGLSSLPSWSARRQAELFHVRCFRTHVFVSVVWYSFLVAFWSLDVQPQRIKFSQVIRFCIWEQGYKQQRETKSPWRLGSCCGTIGVRFGFGGDGNVG